MNPKNNNRLITGSSSDAFPSKMTVFYNNLMVCSCSGNILIIKRTFVIREGEYSFDDWLAEIGSPLLKAEFVLAEIDTVSFGRFVITNRSIFL